MSLRYSKCSGSECGRGAGRECMMGELTQAYVGSKEHLKPIDSLLYTYTDLHARTCTCSTTMAAYIVE